MLLETDDDDCHDDSSLQMKARRSCGARRSSGLSTQPIRHEPVPIFSIHLAHPLRLADATHARRPRLKILKRERDPFLAKSRVTTQPGKRHAHTCVHVSIGGVHTFHDCVNATRRCSPQEIAYRVNSLIAKLTGRLAILKIERHISRD